VLPFAVDTRSIFKALPLPENGLSKLKKTREC